MIRSLSEVETMNTLLVPLGYPGYPQAALKARIEEAKEYLGSIGLSVRSTRDIITLSDCPGAVEDAKGVDTDFCILLVASWVEVTNAMNVVYAAGLDRLPLLLWSLDNVFDEQAKELISFGSIAAASVLRQSFEEFEFRFKFVVGNCGDETLTNEILDFSCAAKAVARLKSARIGLIGYVSMGMYTGLGDHVKVKKLTGTEIVQLDQYTLINKAQAISGERLEKQKQLMVSQWDFDSDVDSTSIDKTAAFYLALKDLAEEHRLDAITVKCQYELSIEFGFTPCVALSMLGEEMPVSCEGDVYMLLTQLFMNYVTGQTTTYGDVLGFSGDKVISASCGFAPRCFLNREKPVIKNHTALYTGLLVTTGFKNGIAATVARLANDKSGFKMHLIDCETDELKDFHEIDCPPYPGTVMRLRNKDANTFKNEVMSQHYVMVFGEYMQPMQEFCDLLDIRVV